MKVAVDIPDAYYIVAGSDGPEFDTRVVKHGDTFAVFDAFGDMTGSDGQQGLYHDGTRHLSRLQLRVAGHRPLLLGSSPGAGSHVLTVDLTNPDLLVDGRVMWPKGTLHIRRTCFLWDATCYTLITFANHGQSPMALPIELFIDGDFRDVFEVRGTRRRARGRQLPVRGSNDGLVLSYQGLDGIVRQTIVQMDPVPEERGAARSAIDAQVLPGERRDLTVVATCGGQGLHGSLRERLTEALTRATSEIEGMRSRLAVIGTSNAPFDQWLERSRTDIAMMVTHTPHGPYPYAGIPWFSTMFGRDGILTALSVLWADPWLARGVLLALAATQATFTDPGADAQPGKILHEARTGEMAALGEIPFGAYYGSVDATPLFVLLAGRYFDRTGDLATIERLWPHIDAALKWMDRYGDVDGDGFVEYARASSHGLTNQGWKDSHDAVFHADGALAEGPIALCEVQAYVYAAKHHAAELAAALGDGRRGRRLRREAEHLHDAFERAFWCEDLGTYAMALDGRKQPCRIVSSNAAQCLLSGIAVPERARRLADGVMRADMFSGWGVRTIRAGEARYNPMAYHNGSVWPHDTALIALGMARYGFKDHVVRLAAGLVDASQQFEIRRLPELFCGFTRLEGEPPTRYPTACAPQAWASASAYLIVQALLGLDVDGRRRRVTVRQPRLPPTLEWLRLTRLSVGPAELDLLCERRGLDVGISIGRRTGDIAVMTEK